MKAKKIQRGTYIDETVDQVLRSAAKEQHRTLSGQIAHVLAEWAKEKEYGPNNAVQAGEETA